MLHSSSAASGKPRSAARTKPKNFKAKLKKALPTLFLLAFAALFAVFPDRYVPVCLDGIALWALNVLPAVFPFLFVTALLRASGGAQRVSRVFSPFAKALFGTGGEGGFCFFMSILSGYPVGASLVSAFKADGVFSDDEAQILACACSTSGPLFVIGSVGAGMFSDKKIGFAILAAHLLAALLSGVLLRFFYYLRRRGGKRNPCTKKQSARTRTKDFSLAECVQNSALSAIGVGGCIAVFYVLAAMASDFGLLYPLQRLIGLLPQLAPCAEGLSKGIVEMTGGCLALAGLETPLAAPCCAFLVTLGGASILFQQIAYLRSADINLFVFLSVKLLQAAGAFFLCLLFVAL